MINELHTIVADILKQGPLDARTCHTNVYPEAPGGATVVFECSDAAVLEEVHRRVKALPGPTKTVSFVSLPDGGESLPELLITASSVADFRKAPAHSSELVSQVVCGDALEPLKLEGDWYLVRLEDGYIGWVRSWHVKEVSRGEFEAGRAAAGHRVRSNIIQIYQEPDEESLPVSDAVVGTRVRLERCDKRGWRAVALPDDRHGFTKSRGIEAMPRGHRISREHIISTGMRFLGIPYLWGGTTPKGFDCSGLMQRIFQLHGVSIPRDSDQQSVFGRAKRAGHLDDLKTGDLLFFGRSASQISHVAMYLSNALFLHAHGQVRVASLDPTNPLYEKKLVRDWQITRDPLAA
jgi:hypothetical protein